ncbi:MAG: glycosyltransferase [Methanomassiliicoccales archaeon]
MKLLVVQESDWLDVGVHDSHHIFERLSAEGWKITVIDYEIRNLGKKGETLFNKRQVFNGIKKATKSGSVQVIRPSFIRMPVLNYLSIPFTHYSEIKRELINNRPDAVIGMGIINTCILAALSKKFKIPFFYYMIDQLDELIPIRSMRWVGRGMIHFSVSNAVKVIVTNNKLLGYARSLGAGSDQLEVVGHGVDPSLYQGVDGKIIRNELGFKDDEIVLFFMGWLYNFCGLDSVADGLEAFGGKVKLLVIGKGEMYDSLKDKAKRNENIVLLEWQPFEELPKYIMASDICILPFIKNEITSNIVPLKIYEYLAAGKPVISTRLSGIVEEFKDEGIIHYIQNPEEIWRALKEVAGDATINNAREDLREFINKQTWESKTDAFKSVLNGKLSVKFGDRP